MIHNVKVENKIKPKHVLGSIWENKEGFTYMIIHNPSNHQYCLLNLHSATCCEITTRDPSFPTIEALTKDMKYLGQQSKINIEITN